MLEISARQETRRVPVAALDLADRRSGSLNAQAGILVGMARKIPLPRTDAHARKMTRLREVFRKHFGINDDPFEDYRPGAGWVPRFTIVDKRGGADEHAKTAAERRSVEYDDQKDYTFDDEDDDTGKFIRER
jgi:hypothetical protein